MKAYWRVGVKVHAFLTSTLDGGKWSASCPDLFSPGEGVQSKYSLFIVRKK